MQTVSVSGFSSIRRTARADAQILDRTRIISIRSNPVFVSIRRHTNIHKNQNTATNSGTCTLGILQLYAVMESLECTVLVGNLERLKNSNVDLAHFARELGGANVIRREDSERAAGVKDRSAREGWDDLIVAVMKNKNQGAFQAFINVILQTSELKGVGEKMKGILNIWYIAFHYP